jgi:hypothetical protein
VQELLQILNVAAYLALGYLVMVALVWLVTRGEPDLWMFRDLALKPVLFVLAPFGIEFAPQASRPEVREMLEREREEDSPTMATSTNRFQSIRAAKEYLVGRIVAEAERKAVPLTEVERKMLYFSETGWTLSGILEVNEEFERDYDTDTYERKVAGLARAAQDRFTAEEREAWDDAVVRLSEGDHYLLVLIGGTAPQWEPFPQLSKLGKRLGPWLPTSYRSGPRPRGDLDRLFLIGAGFTVLFSIVLIVLYLTRALGH